MPRSQVTLVRRTRAPAVAGAFYPDRPDALRAMVRRLLDGAPIEEGIGVTTTKALIAPHAGYVYSGPVAASAFARLAPMRDRVRRVVLIGPSHFVPFRGIATSGAAAFATPLGEVEVDLATHTKLAALPGVIDLPAAHGREHGLEVELPFLQEALASFAIVPLVVGEATHEEVGRALDLLWDGDETLVVVSSDLSHYLDYESASRLDASTARAIEELRWEAIEPEHACGHAAIRGLLWTAHRRGLEVATLDLRSSGDTAGRRDAVVGYGAWALGEATPAPPPAPSAPRLA
jgi:AmmeMemoRadiSam system protein B